MSDAVSHPPYQPSGWPTLTARIITQDVGGLAAFLKVVFGARGEVNVTRPTELRIGDSVVMISDGGDARAAMPAFLYVYVPDTDAAFRNAINLGAASVEEPATMAYGDRRATVRDRWGNIWQIATFGPAD